MFRFISLDRGQSVVEMALVLPILLLLLFGIMEGGRLFAGYVELQNAARDGARFTSIHSNDFPTTTMTTAQWRDTVLKPRIDQDLVMLNPAGVNVDLNKTTVTTGDSMVVVTLDYNLKIFTPIISNIIATDKTNSTVALRSEMSMRGE